MDSPHQNKVVLVGDTNVGKTSIIKRAVLNQFQTDLVSTVAPNYLELNKEVNGSLIKLHVYDTAGQERYSGMNRLFYQDALAVMIIYAFDDLQSFTNVEKWYNEIIQTLNKDNIFIHLVANKADLLVNNAIPVISTENGEKKAKELGVDFACVSAKTGNNIDDLFNLIATQIDEKYDYINPQHDGNRLDIVDLTKDNQDDEKKCC